MQQFAEILDVPISFFFENVVQAKAGDGTPRAHDETIAAVNEFIASRDGIALIRSFSRIINRGLRRALVGVIEELADYNGRLGR